MKIKHFCGAILTIGLIITNASCSSKQEEKKKEEHIHTFSYVPFEDSTCIKEGVLAHYYCSKCEKMYEDQNGKAEIIDVVISKKAHNYEFISKTDATCVDAGYCTYKCSACGNIDYRDFSKCTEHLFDETKTQHHDATCIEPGYDVCYCTNCKKNITCNFTDVLGHLDSTTILPVTYQGLTKSLCVSHNSFYIIHNPN